MKKTIFKAGDIIANRIYPEDVYWVLSIDNDTVYYELCYFGVQEKYIGTWPVNTINYGCNLLTDIFRKENV